MNIIDYDKHENYNLINNVKQNDNKFIIECFVNDVLIYQKIFSKYNIAHKAYLYNIKAFNNLYNKYKDYFYMFVDNGFYGVNNFDTSNLKELNSLLSEHIELFGDTDIVNVITPKKELTFDKLNEPKTVYKITNDKHILLSEVTVFKVTK